MNKISKIKLRHRKILYPLLLKHDLFVVGRVLTSPSPIATQLAKALPYTHLRPSFIRRVFFLLNNNASTQQAVAFIKNN